jgi:hypothetical protein
VGPPLVGLPSSAAGRDSATIPRRPSGGGGRAQRPRAPMCRRRRTAPRWRCRSTWGSELGEAAHGTLVPPRSAAGPASPAESLRHPGREDPLAARQANEVGGGLACPLALVRRKVEDVEAGADRAEGELQRSFSSRRLTFSSKVSPVGGASMRSGWRQSLDPVGLATQQGVLISMRPERTSGRPSGAGRRRCRRGAWAG